MARRREKLKLETYSTETPDVLELIARMLVPSSYRVPVEGRSSRPSMTPSDVSGAVGLSRSDRLGTAAAVAVATRAPDRQIARLAWRAYRRVARAVKAMPDGPLDLGRGEDRWRLRIVVYDASHALVWPERRQSLAAAAKAAKIRASTYAELYKLASATLEEALADGRRDFKRRLFAST